MKIVFLLNIYISNSIFQTYTIIQINKLTQIIFDITKMLYNNLDKQIFFTKT